MSSVECPPFAASIGFGGHSAAVPQKAFAVRQNGKSQTKAATKNAIGKGISIECKGWPAIEAVLLGLDVVGVGIGESPPPREVP